MLQEFHEKQVRHNLILQKIKYLQWIKDWDDDFNPVLQREEIIELIQAGKKSNDDSVAFLNDPDKIASNISFKTLILSFFKKLSKKAGHTPKA